MLVIPTLYEIAAKDLATGAVPQRFVRRSVQSTAAAFHSFRPLQGLARDRVLLLTHLTIDARAGAAQTVTQITAQLEDEVNAALMDIGVKIVLPAPARDVLVLNLAEPIVVMPLESILLQTDYNAGAVVNTSVFGMHGVMIPRGNWQLS